MVLYSEANPEQKLLYSGQEGARDTELHRVLKRTGVDSEALKVIESNPELINLATERSGRTPLHICCAPPQVLGYMGYAETAKELVKRGAEVNAVDKDGNTPIHLALSRGNFELVSFLVQNGANLDIENNKVQTPREFINEVKEDALKRIKDPKESKDIREQAESYLEQIGSILKHIEAMESSKPSRKNLKILGKEFKDRGIVSINGMSLGDMASKVYNAMPNISSKRNNKGQSR